MQIKDQATSVYSSGNFIEEKHSYNQQHQSTQLCANNNNNLINIIDQLDASMQASPIIYSDASDMEHKFTQVDFDINSPILRHIGSAIIDQNTQTCPGTFMSEKYTQLDQLSSPEF